MLRLSLCKNTEKEIIAEALRVLKNGGIVAYPTESFYALGVMAADGDAVKKLYRLKKRHLKKAMPVIVGDDGVLKTMVKSIPLHALRLMKKFWPGPLTLIFNASNNLPGLLPGRMNKIAVRIPGKSFALTLAKAAGFPITATSANLSGSMPAQSPDEVIDYFGETIDLVVDGHKTPGGKPSTIVDVTVDPPKVLREGSILLKARINTKKTRFSR